MRLKTSFFLMSMACGLIASVTANCQQQILVTGTIQFTNTYPFDVSPVSASVFVTGNGYTQASIVKNGYFVEGEIAPLVPFNITRVNSSIRFDYNLNVGGHETNTVNLSSNPLGIKVPMGTIGILHDDISGSPHFHDCEMSLTLGVLKPSTPVLKIGSPSLNCIDKTIQIKADMDWSNLSGLAWVWEYQNPTSKVWTEIGRSDNNQFAFTPSTVFNFPVIQNADVAVRVKAIAVEMDGPYSDPLYINFAPTAPSIATADISLPSACAGLGNGAITLNNIQKNTSTILYSLLAGSNPADCNPLNNAGACSGSVISNGIIGNNSYTIPGIGQGTYTLVLSNPGGTQGSCHNNYPVTITQIPVMQVNSAAKTDATCSGASDGAITFDVKDGDASNIQYAITPNAGTITVNGRSAVFNNLPKGNYTVSATDGCGTTVSSQQTIDAPIAISGTCLIQSPQCDNPASGSVTVNVTGGSSTFNYTLYKSGTQIAQNNGSTNTAQTFGSLSTGSYSIEVKDASRPNCTGYTQAFTLTSMPALTLSLNGKTDVSCYGANNGAISLRATGGNNAFDYTLINTATSQTFTNTTGSFSGLPKGTYNATVKKAGIACDDAAILNGILIAEPQGIAITLSPTSVSCYGAGDGAINANVSGGMGNYTYNWQMQTGTTWSSLSGANAGIGNLQSGSYRLAISDGNSCNKYSEVVNVAEPAKLAITSAQGTDILCYGDKAVVTLNPTGGNGGYIYEYSNASNWTIFNNGASQFAPGDYQLRVRDSKGCIANYSGTLNITAPSSALSFSQTISNYNGFNVSCYGSNNGMVTINATGGNGSGYSGYHYSMDGNSWQVANNWNNVTAGGHALQVKDGRGCIVSSTVQLTQPASALTLNLASQTNVECYGASTGAFTVQAAGGLSPYAYSVNNGTVQSVNTFNALSAANYNVKATDQNGCAQSLSVNVVNLHPQILLTPSIQEISCNGKNNGAISLQLLGGSAPYQYAWSGLTANGPAVNNLAEGNYNVTITDSRGCVQTGSYVITQPPSLQAAVNTKPVCYGATYGVLDITSSGGTMPYQYSVDGGKTFQPGNIFNSVGAGNYTALVKDANGCTTADMPATIGVRNDMPSLNFLVSTRQNALDTLQIKEVNVPKADSLRWTYDNNAIIINNDSKAPQIKYSAPGTYPVVMTGWFGGCDYSLSKNISINPYDPTALPENVNPISSIDTVIVYPNPNNGTFTVKVKLNRKQNVILSIHSLAAAEVYNKRIDAVDEINQAITLPANTVAGVYVLRMITNTDSKDIRIIVNR